MGLRSAASGRSVAVSRAVASSRAVAASRSTPNSSGSAPNTPTGLTATPGSSSVLLNFQYGGESAVTFNIYRGTTSGGETTLATDQVGTQYTDSSLPGTNDTVYYKVAAVNAAGTSPQSGEASCLDPTFFDLFTDVGYCMMAGRLFQNSNGTTPATADTNPVGYNGDLSGKGYNGTQATNGQRPLLKLSVLNGLPVLRFTAASSMFLGHGTIGGKPVSYTIFIVLATTNIAARQFAYGSSDSGGADATGWGWGIIKQTGQADGTVTYGFGDGTVTSDGVTAAAQYVNNTFAMSTVRYTTGQTAEEFWKNGAAQSVTVSVSNASSLGGTAQNFSVGRGGDLDAIYLGGDVAALLISKTAMSNVARARVEAALALRYGF